MIRKYSFGEHFDTEAVVVPVAEGEVLPLFSTRQTPEGLILHCKLAPEDIVYGLGETVGPINKRGHKYISYNVDNPHHREDTVSLYASHNFLVIDGEKTWGFFLDTPARVIFDVGAADPDVLRIRCTGGVTVYAIDGAGAYDVVRQFLSVIGRSYLPPRWAFGFGQSRWGYKTERDIRKVVDGYRDRGLPLEYVCMDIDYMDRFIDFTVNKRRFPDLPGFVAELKTRGIRLVPIVDAGIKIEPGNPVYDEGVEKGYFCVDKDGKPYGAAVWPGMTHFPDFLRSDVREWFGSQYKFYTDQGLEGFWNDMNEPAIFYTEDTKGCRKDALEGEDDEFQKDTNICAYKRFYHRPNGQMLVHHDVHNLFGYGMTRSSGEGLSRLMDKRYLLFSRSSYIGAHRYGGIWTGDNGSCWEHLKMNVRQMPSLNMCGFLFSGADTGGFGGNTSRELLLRWLAFSAFTPLMRDHSALLTRKQECYRFSGTEDFRRILTLRYRLLPYLYSEFMKAALEQDMLIKPLAFVFPEDPAVRTIEDQLMVGESVMIAPLTDKGRLTRKVYLPEDMTKVFYTGGEFVCTPAKKGTQTVRAELDEVVFFIRKGHAMPVGKPCLCTAELDMTALALLGDGESYELYDDDGFTKDCGREHIRLLRRE